MADEKPTMRLRFRRTTTLGGAVYQANALAMVEATDEAWDVVNRGEADMEPGPGVAGQPFPPEDMTRDETTDVPVPGTLPATPRTPAPPKRGTRPVGDAPAPLVPPGTPHAAEAATPRTEPAPNPKIEKAEPATAPPVHEEPKTTPPSFNPTHGKHRK